MAVVAAFCTTAGFMNYSSNLLSHLERSSPHLVFSGILRKERFPLRKKVKFCREEIISNNVLSSFKWLVGWICHFSWFGSNYVSSRRAGSEEPAAPPPHSLLSPLKSVWGCGNRHSCTQIQFSHGFENGSVLFAHNCHASILSGRQTGTFSFHGSNFHQTKAHILNFLYPLIDWWQEMGCYAKCSKICCFLLPTSELLCSVRKHGLENSSNVHMTCSSNDSGFSVLLAAGVSVFHQLMLKLHCRMLQMSSGNKPPRQDLTWALRDLHALNKRGKNKIKTKWGYSIQLTTHTGK